MKFVKVYYFYKIYSRSYFEDAEFRQFQGFNQITPGTTSLR